MRRRPPQGVRIELADGTVVYPDAVTYQGRDDDGIAVWRARFPSGLLDALLDDGSARLKIDVLPARTGCNLAFGEDLS